jgi:hypothetical protein
MNLDMMRDAHELLDKCSECGAPAGFGWAAFMKAWAGCTECPARTLTTGPICKVMIEWNKMQRGAHEPADTI